mgnify:CR=1 FL=1
MGDIYAHSGFDFLNVTVEESQQGHLCVFAALKHILDRCCIEIGLALHECVEGGVCRQQQFLDFSINLHSLPALPVQSAFPAIPQLWCAGEFATELRHCAVHGNLPIIGALPDLSNPLLLR